MNLKKYKFLEQLISHPLIDEIWLFGSRARGDNQDRSDIDIAVIAPKASEKDYNEIKNIIDNADTLLKIDCVWFDKLSDSDTIKLSILSDKKILFKRSSS